MFSTCCIVPLISGIRWFNFTVSKFSVEPLVTQTQNGCTGVSNRSLLNECNVGCVSVVILTLNQQQYETWAQLFTGSTGWFVAFQVKEWLGKCKSLISCSNLSICKIASDEVICSEIKLYWSRWFSKFKNRLINGTDHTVIWHTTSDSLISALMFYFISESDGGQGSKVPLTVWHSFMTSPCVSLQCRGRGSAVHTPASQLGAERNTWEDHLRGPPAGRRAGVMRGITPPSLQTSAATLIFSIRRSSELLDGVMGSSTCYM